VAVDVVNPLPPDDPDMTEPITTVANATPPEAANRPPRRVLHTRSALIILGLDWLLFSGSAASGGLGIPLSVTLGFLGGALGTLLVQRRTAGDSWPKALAKAVAAGVVVGVPFPIGGTVVGGGILALAGLDSLKSGLLSKRN
jgi:hypothetical protein